MGFKTIIAMAFAAVGGIYLTSDEGKKAREALRSKKTIFEPIIKRLIKQANDMLEGNKRVDSKKIRENIETLANEAKNLLVSINLEKTTDTIKDAIKVASKKIRDASNEKNKKIKSIRTKKQ